MSDQGRAPEGPGREIVQVFGVMGMIDALVQEAMEKPELEALLKEAGRRAGMNLFVHLEGRHSAEWLSKKARDAVYAKTAAVAMRELNHALGLDPEFYG